MKLFGTSCRNTVQMEKLAESGTLPYFSCDIKLLTVVIYRKTSEDKNILIFLSFLYGSPMVLLLGVLLFFCLSTELTSCLFLLESNLEEPFASSYIMRY